MCFVIDGGDAVVTIFRRRGRRRHYLLLLRDQSYAEFECLLAVLWEDSLVADFPCVAVHACDMITAVILNL